MKLLLFLFGAALAAGLYFVLADMLKIPRLATERALISAGRKERSLVKSMETLNFGMVAEAGSADPLGCPQTQTAGNEADCRRTGYDPRGLYGLHRSEALSHPAGDHPCLLILPILTPLVVVLALLTYFKESRRADELCKARMELVEGELPRFVATIHQELAASGMSCAFWRTTRNMPVLTLPVNWMC